MFARVYLCTYYCMHIYTYIRMHICTSIFYSCWVSIQCVFVFVCWVIFHTNVSCQQVPNKSCHVPTSSVSHHRGMPSLNSRKPHSNARTKESCLISTSSATQFTEACCTSTVEPLQTALNTPTKESCHTPTSHVNESRMSRVTQTNESCHTYQRVTDESCYTPTSPATHINNPPWDIPLTNESDVTHINESCHVPINRRRQPSSAGRQLSGYPRQHMQRAVLGRMKFCVRRRADLPSFATPSL